MKKEIMRVRDVNVHGKAGEELKYINFYLLEGEITGFLGLSNSGKDMLVRVLSGRQTFESGHVSVCGERIVKFHDLDHLVYILKDSNFLIEDWSVAEYTGLVDNRILNGFGGILRQRELNKEIQEMFDHLQVGILVQRKIGELTEMEKRLVDLVKAYKRKARILVIEDEFDGLSQKEIQEFKTTLKRIIRGRMTAIVNNHSDLVTGTLSDKLIIFKKGEVVKKCTAEHICNPQFLEKYLLGTSIRPHSQGVENDRLHSASQNEIIYRMSQTINKSGREREYIFRKGEITTILSYDRKEKEDMFYILSGRAERAGIKRWINDAKCEFEDIADYVRHKIISIMHLGNMEELLPGMSVGENILMPSLNKISSLEYTLAERQMVKMLEKEMIELGIKKDKKIKELGLNDRIALTLERWHVYSPKVIILLEPFAQCDLYGVALVKSYIKKIASDGTAVIVVKSRDEYMEDISDHVIFCENNVL